MSNDDRGPGGSTLGGAGSATLGTGAIEETKVDKTQNLPTTRGIFSLKSKQQAAKDRFNQKAQDYLESYKMSIYM